MHAQFGKAAQRRSPTRQQGEADPTPRPPQGGGAPRGGDGPARSSAARLSGHRQARHKQKQGGSRSRPPVRRSRSPSRRCPSMIPPFDPVVNPEVFHVEHFMPFAGPPPQQRRHPLHDCASRAAPARVRYSLTRRPAQHGLLGSSYGPRGRCTLRSGAAAAWEGGPLRLLRKRNPPPRPRAPHPHPARLGAAPAPLTSFASHRRRAGRPSGALFPATTWPGARLPLLTCSPRQGRFAPPTAVPFGQPCRGCARSPVASSVRGPKKARVGPRPFLARGLRGPRGGTAYGHAAALARLRSGPPALRFAPSRAGGLPGLRAGQGLRAPHFQRRALRGRLRFAQAARFLRTSCAAIKRGGVTPSPCRCSTWNYLAPGASLSLSA